MVLHCYLPRARPHGAAVHPRAALTHTVAEAVDELHAHRDWLVCDGRRGRGMQSRLGGERRAGHAHELDRRARDLLATELHAYHVQPSDVRLVRHLVLAHPAFCAQRQLDMLAPHRVFTSLEVGAVKRRNERATRRVGRIVVLVSQLRLERELLAGDERAALRGLVTLHDRGGRVRLALGDVQRKRRARKFLPLRRECWRLHSEHRLRRRRNARDLLSGHAPHVELEVARLLGHVPQLILVAYPLPVARHIDPGPVKAVLLAGRPIADQLAVLAAARWRLLARQPHRLLLLFGLLGLRRLGGQHRQPKLHVGQRLGGVEVTVAQPHTHDRLLPRHGIVQTHPGDLARRDLRLRSGHHQLRGRADDVQAVDGHVHRVHARRLRPPAQHVHAVAVVDAARLELLGLHTVCLHAHICAALRARVAHLVARGHQDAVPLLADGSAVDRSAHVPPTTLGRAPVRVRVGPHGHDAAAATAAALRAQTLGSACRLPVLRSGRLGHLGRRRVRASRHHVQHEGRAGERGRLLPQSDVQFIIAGEADAVAHRVRLDELAFGMQRTWRDSAECEADAVLIEEELVRQAHADLCRLRRRAAATTGAIFAAVLATGRLRGCRGDGFVAG